MKEFDELMGEVKGSGWYVNRLLWFLLVPVFFLMPFQFLHQIFVLSVPPHYCTPPEGLEPETLAMNLTTWQETFLPLELAPDYQMRPSQCNMYNVTPETLTSFLDGGVETRNATPTVSCRDVSGYTYDKTEFDNTAVSDFDWVCDIGQRATDLYTWGTVGLIVGTAFFSAFADWKGRKPAFFAATAIVLVFQLAKIGLAHDYAAYVAVKVIAFFAMLPLFQSPLNIITEMCNIEQRGFVIGVACIAWAIGGMLLPLIGYLLPSWKELTALSVVPMAFVFLTFKILPESPRWLLTSGRLNDAERVIREIAKVNKAQVPKDLEQRLKAMVSKSKEKSYGYLTLFSSVTMTLRTIWTCVAFTASAFIYYQLMINIGNMGGNTFMNMFLLSLVEGPGSLVGVAAADWLGRRWTHAGILFINAVCFFILTWIVQDPTLVPLVTVLCMVVKFNISATFTVAYVQAMEVFPTTVRQSGIGIATLVSQMISIGGPYVIYLGATDLRLPYLVMFLICCAGTVATALLPETAGRSLPETMADANAFGKDDKFFSWKAPIFDKKKKTDENGHNDKLDDDEAEKQTLKAGEST